MRDFDQKIQRYGTQAAKFDGASEYFGMSGVTPLWVADMDFASAECIKNAIIQRAEHNIYGYTLKNGKIIETIQRWLQVRHGFCVQADEIALASGVVTSVNIALNAFTQPGDGVVIQTPVYHPFARSIKANQREVITSPLVYENGRYSIDFDNLDASLQKAKMLILCNPHNPTGRVFSQKELEKIADLCLRHNVMVFSDEIHFDIVYGLNRHIPIASLGREIAKQTLTATAASKTFNIAGCSTSYVIANNQRILRKYTQTSKRYIADDGNLFGIVATQAAYEEGEQWVDALNAYLWQNAQFVRQFIESFIPSIKVTPIEATYLMWLNFKEISNDSDALKKLLWQEAKVGMIDGRVFGDEGDGFFRLNIGTQKEVLEASLMRLKDLIN